MLFEQSPDYVPEGREGLEDVVTWEAPTKPGILDGLATNTRLASLGCLNWNQHEGWLRAVDGLRQAA